MIRKHLITATAALSVALLSGCAATTTAISHRNLDVQTKMSDTVFLEPVAKSKRTVFVEVKNTSDKSEFDISKLVKDGIANKGYTVTDDPDKAHYMLQANILTVEKMSPKAANSLLSGGYGAAIGAGTAAVLTHDGTDTIAGGIIGGIAGSVADAMVKDVNYAVITDVQLSERTTANVKQTTQANLKQGSSSMERQSSSETTHWKRYRTRILSTADKVNLDFKDAEPALEKGLSTSIAGLF